MDDTLIGRGLKRTPFPRFLLWLVPWAALLGVGLYAAYLCLAAGLNQTNMDNRFAFGLWIYLDLTVIALGAGAFFTGFLLYVMKRRELAAVINSAVVIGFICYSGAVAILAIDVGQPLRFWFTFWHPNVHSMLTEVTFCLTLYLTVLAIEYLPVVLRNRQLKKRPSMLVFEFELHKVMAVFALVGTFLSFFHQGSLGGLYGVLQGRPFAYRESFLAWPSTFFLFILSAAAVGPSFVLATTWIVSKVSGRRLVKPEVFDLLARVSGSLLLVYVLASLKWKGIAPRGRRRAATFLLLVLLIGPGLIVNTFKDAWGRARPVNVEELGGDRRFTPALLPSDQCKRNCAFTSGHAAFGFWWMAPAFVDRRRRGMWLALGLALGLGIGLLRIAQGGHFVSDVLFSGWIVYGTMLALRALFLRRPRRRAGAVS